MNKKILFGLACAISMAVGGAAANADTLNFGSSPGSDTFTATSINITNPGNVAPVSGAYFAGLVCNACLTFSPTVWNAGTGTETMTVVSGALTDVIKITSFAFTGTDSNMTILGSGTSQINGGSIVGVTFSLTTQLAAGTSVGTPTSFSGSVATIVPLPGALMLFGSGLVGLAALGRRKQKQKQLAAA
jgi:hypothetical protein